MINKFLFGSLVILFLVVSVFCLKLLMANLDYAVENMYLRYDKKLDDELLANECLKADAFRKAMDRLGWKYEFKDRNETFSFPLTFDPEEVSQVIVYKYPSDDKYSEITVLFGRDGCQILE